MHIASFYHQGFHTLKIILRFFENLSQVFFLDLQWDLVVPVSIFLYL